MQLVAVQLETITHYCFPIRTERYILPRALQWSVSDHKAPAGWMFVLA